MITIRPFRGYRPPSECAEAVVAQPYDVVDSAEARQRAEGNPRSLFHITKPEIDFEPGCGEHDPRVYGRAVANYQAFVAHGWLRQDAAASYYLYSETLQGRTQTGWVVGAAVADYMGGIIKKHELTRPDKEEDRMKHIRNIGANVEPVFLAYPTSASLEALAAEVIASAAPNNDLTTDDGVRHRLWVIDNPQQIRAVTEAFAAFDALYIADGHHRTAAAARVGAEMATANPHHTGREEYNFFMAVCFPADQLRILGYHRLVRDLNGMTTTEFLAHVAESFDIEPLPAGADCAPRQLHEFTLYMDSRWYRLTARPAICDDSDPILGLDVSISSRHILGDILGITDLRRDQRIDFVGGLDGFDQMRRRVDSGEMKLGLGLHPVSMSQLMAIADSGGIMPPKATWFVPKLLSGLVIHALTD